MDIEVVYIGVLVLGLIQKRLCITNLVVQFRVLDV